MKVLVTGATGFVGSHVVDVLLERGYTVSYVARATSNVQWLHDKEASRMDGSLFDMHSLRSAVEQADMVIHVAGLTAAKNENEFMRGNRDATRNVLDAIRAYRPELKRYVHVSSLAVSGPSHNAETCVTETSGFRPITAYGRTKKLAEDLVNEAGKEFPITIVRPPAVYGPRDSAILTFFQTVKKGIAPLIGFNEKKLSLIHVRDLARGIVDAAESEKAIGQTYFLSSDEAYTWPQIADVTAEVLGRKRLIKLRIPHPLVYAIAGISGFVAKLRGKAAVLDYEKGHDITQAYWTCNNDKARRDFGFHQEISLEDGVRETVEWYRKHDWL